MQLFNIKTQGLKEIWSYCLFDTLKPQKGEILLEKSIIRDNILFWLFFIAFSIKFFIGWFIFCKDVINNFFNPSF